MNASLIKSSKMWAPTAPASDDPKRCRWCHGSLIVLQDTKQTVYCPAGCSQDHLFTRWCLQCRRNFETGNLQADVCWDCDSREDAAIQASMGPISKHGPANVGRGSRTRRG